MIALIRSISAKKMLPSEAILECFCAGVGKRKGRRSEKMGKKRSKRFGVRGFFGERRGKLAGDCAGGVAGGFAGGVAAFKQKRPTVCGRAKTARGKLRVIASNAYRRATFRGGS